MICTLAVPIFLRQLIPQPDGLQVPGLHLLHQCCMDRGGFFCTVFDRGGFR